MIVQKRTELDWDALRTFLAVARTGSLSGAARSLGVNHATVARRLAALEATLGRPLLERTRDGYRPTEAGRAAQPEVELMEEAATALRRAVDAGDEMAGLVQVSATATFGERLLAGPLAAFAIRYPGLAIELVAEDRNISLARGEADIAVRMGRPVSGDALTRRLGDLPYRLYGTPAYLDRLPPAERQLIGLTRAVAERAPAAAALTRLAGGRPIAMRCAGFGAQAEAAAAGLGLALLPTYLAGADQRLVPATDEAAAWSQPLWLLTRSDVRRIVRVRRVADHIADILAGTVRPS